MILGVDIGGTKIGIGLVTKSGVLKSSTSYPTESKRGAAVVLQNIKAAIAAHTNRSVTAIGIGIAGQVDHKRGVFRGGPNLPKNFKNVRLVEMLRKEFRKPVVMDNDVHCFALAEALVGAGKRYRNVYGVTLGTGIGGGLAQNGVVIHGATGTAAEVGHMIINTQRHGLRCSCNQFGHLESYAAGEGMTRRYKQMAKRTINAHELEKLYKHKNKHATRIVTEGAHALAVGLTNILTTANPDCIVLGGGLANFRAYISLALNEVPKLVPFPHLKKTPILHAKLGTKAGVIGAALLTK
jgi:glucokinase